ncbi:paeninodin family lasso peptide [Paenisporosarcina antarctica]|uniref:Paeninodin family lasso peptide n=1 Tax=Paenisporosarcina antarctica TaxID=417367 RepID=A0A4P6ZZS6_9BACL|nr:paeninodin family lasso peptide [Paenisporosarcina antarctica]QBP41997.1 paeninodin family lasso peptide [Paenisporosarcina antarctica]
MKKQWKKPELEVLDVNMTMLNFGGEHTDASFPANTPVGKITSS